MEGRRLEREMDWGGEGRLCVSGLVKGFEGVEEY